MFAISVIHSFALVHSLALGRCKLKLSALEETERSLIAAVGGPRAAVYGEITADGFQKLAQHIGLDCADSFIDLGSGEGAIVLQAASEYGVTCSMGVELSPSRHQAALSALTRFPAAVRARSTFICGDAAGSGAALDALSRASVGWCCNMMFDDSFQRRLAERIGDHADRMRILVVTMPFPEGVKGFVQAKVPAMCRMSWDIHNRDHPCVVYVREVYGADRTRDMSPGT